MRVRKAAVAGSFYPADGDILAQYVDQLLDESASVFSENGDYQPESAPQKHVLSPDKHSSKALIVPHAGYQYSGKIAAYAYSMLRARKNKISRIVLLGPCHRVWIEGLAIPSVEYFSTPLGEIPLDKQKLQELTQFVQIQISDLAHQEEHSLEVQIPFIQRIFDKIKLIPIAVGGASTEQVSEIIEYLWEGAETIFLISSDLSHFLDYHTARETDRKTTEYINNLDYQSLNHEMACGSTPIQGLLKVAQEKSMQVSTLAQCNSGDTAGDKSRVVGYASYAIY
ncbi:AmmeMemoRadiSam system protein B [Aliikangiella coralliicola]|uniref:MEMO1 family protein FLL46_16385 n=1 Tax=Aliikangiella coralliicola TaxID=2592383 RepID=A0A545UAK3_9GAMM|nr:AmmeMemoRadiSam system protein B [Aliikangiella coralliicola]TQV86489.1 AmmeMemoRadiSam system protein B [Aliikangiella coralliicola]